MIEGNVIFNLTISILGTFILLVHIINALLKKNKRNDENALLTFIIFTAFHFIVYFIFNVIRIYYTWDSFIISFYTLFYVFNNIEAFLLFIYMMCYVFLKKNIRKTLYIVDVSIFLIFLVLDFANIYTHIFFSADGGEYVREKTMIISQGYQFVTFAIVFFTALFNKRLNIREKIAFIIYCLLPLVAIILQNRFKGYAIAYASIIVSVEILFFFVNIQKNIDLAEKEEKNKEAQIRLMISQIQPHFIYNSLSAISTLIKIDQDKAQKTLDDFTEYLRCNLSSLTEEKYVPIENELRHIRTYLALEKVRFQDRINIVYDIKTTDFSVPPLSIEPIVENAIKHGILKKMEGGTVTIRVYEAPSAYVIEVTDNGVGFDIKNVDFSKNKHIGLLNIKYRIEAMNGTLDIDSKVGIGTKVTVKFHK